MNMPTPLASSYCFVQVAQTINIGFLVSESVIYLFDLLLTICLRYKQHTQYLNLFLSLLAWLLVIMICLVIYQGKSDKQRVYVFYHYNRL